MRRLVATLLLLAQLAGSSAAWAVPTGLAGRWLAPTTGGPAELLVERGGLGFYFRLTVAGRTVFDARFAPTARPGVLEAAATGLFSILGSGRTAANPLEGEELVWAREAVDELVASRLAIAQGRPVIERVRVAPLAERLQLRVERLEGERMVSELEIELVRTAR